MHKEPKLSSIARFFLYCFLFLNILQFFILCFYHLYTLGYFGFGIGLENREYDLFSSKLPNIKHIPDQSFEKVRTSLLNSTIVHITKEFGPATYGGLGTVVTQLALAQSSAGFKTAVILPYYRYLRNAFDDEILFEKISIKVLDSCLGPSLSSAFPLLFRKQWESLNFSVYQRKYNGVYMYLISPADKFPFTKAFFARDLFSIYYSDFWLDKELQEIYYNAAAAKLLQVLSETGKVHAHVHGATNAMTLVFSKMPRFSNLQFIYTLHDYSYEQRYSLKIPYLGCFDPRFNGLNDEEWPRSLSLKHEIGKYSNKFRVPQSFSTQCQLPLETTVIGNRFYTSGHGILLADKVTFVSRLLLQKILSGKLDFPFRQMMMEYLLHKVRQQKLFGITNGIDILNLNPFIDANLVKMNLNYPMPTWLISKLFQVKIEQESTESIASIKLRAKELLLEKNFFPSEESCRRPLLLFIGRFSFEKGLSDISRISKLLVSLGVNLAIMGQRNDFPMSYLFKLKRLFPENFFIISSETEQRKLGLIVRVAADFSFIPSYTESFGLVAAEGMLMGSAVISTLTGGLSELLIPRRNFASEEFFNSYEYYHASADMNNYKHPAESDNSLVMAIKTAIRDLKVMKKTGILDLFQKRLILHALKLGWNGNSNLNVDEITKHFVYRESRKITGPVFEYLYVYAI